MMREVFDVAVVGAGPSGAWAAYRLATSGARVAIVDPSHPREKPCGGGVTGRALSLVRRALADQRFPLTTIQTARFVHSERDGSSVVALHGAADGPDPDL